MEIKIYALVVAFCVYGHLPSPLRRYQEVFCHQEREVYHLAQAPNGGHIQHPPSHLGDELSNDNFLLDLADLLYHGQSMHRVEPYKEGEKEEEIPLL
jgi:hypothetical protein